MHSICYSYQYLLFPDKFVFALYISILLKAHKVDIGNVLLILKNKIFVKSIFTFCICCLLYIKCSTFIFKKKNLFQ
jgi:hypothetical protein